MKIIKSKILGKFPEISHGYFTKNGGRSAGDFTSLNFSGSGGDKISKVEQNYQLACSHIGIPRNSLITLKQIHSNKLIKVETPKNDEQLHQADGMVCSETNLALGILTADCLPILFYDKNNKIIAAIHAGWKGALSGIIEECLRKIKETAKQKSELYVAIMPAISQESYEIDGNFYKKFIDLDTQNKKYFIPSVNQEHFMFDLKQYAADKLIKEGIENLEIVDFDTYKNPQDMFSYRRSTHLNQKTGNNLSFIMLRC